MADLQQTSSARVVAVLWLPRSSAGSLITRSPQRGGVVWCSGYVGAHSSSCAAKRFGATSR